MIVTSALSIDIVRYLDRRTQGVPLRWTLLSEIADHVYGPEDLAFNQAVDLARCRGWVIVEGKSPSRRAALTKAGCSLVLQEACPGRCNEGQASHGLPFVRAADQQRRIMVGRDVGHQAGALEECCSFRNSRNSTK